MALVKMMVNLQIIFYYNDQAPQRCILILADEGISSMPSQNQYDDYDSLTYFGDNDYYDDQPIQEQEERRSKSSSFCEKKDVTSKNTITTGGKGGERRKGKSLIGKDVLYGSLTLTPY